jgi:hypothetical protein
MPDLTKLTSRYFKAKYGPNFVRITLQAKLYKVDKGLFGLFIFFKHSVKSILPLKAKKIKFKSRVFFVFQTGFLVITN